MIEVRIHVAVLNLLGQQFVGIGARNVEERGAVDAVERVVGQGVLLEQFEDSRRHVVVAGVDDQVAFGLEGLLSELLAELIVQEQQPFLHHLLSELGHAWLSGHHVPFCFDRLHAGGQRVLDAIALAGDRLSGLDIQKIIEGKVDAHEAFAWADDKKDVPSGQPDVQAGNLVGCLALGVLLLAAGIAGAHRIVSIGIDITGEAVVSQFST